MPETGAPTCRNLDLVLAALVLSAGVTYTAQKTDDQVMREVRDRAEIEDLMRRHTRALDTTDAAAAAAVYTPDGQFGTGANATKGREALTKMVADLRASRVANEAKGVRNPPISHDRKPCGHLHRQGSCARRRLLF